MKRLTIYPKDIQRITGKTYRAACFIIARIRKHFNKENHHMITIQEFCAYTGLKQEDVEAMLK